MCPDIIDHSLEGVSLSEKEARTKEELPVSALAFLGDGVYSLMVREYLTVQNRCKADVLHSKTVEMVNASFQARASREILPSLYEDEADIFTRGRNSHTPHTPKSMTKGDYHAATGLETLFGWLYIHGKTQRLKELFGLIANME